MAAAGLLVARPAEAVEQPIDLGNYADTPPMGWSTWNEFGCDVSADLIEEMADAIVASGMADAGYEYVNIDDCWAETARDAEGNLIADTEKFPDGIAGVADYVHSLGLKLGIYSSAGTTTCQRVYPGSLGYEYIDAKNYYDWGVDYIKYDNCGGHTITTANPDPTKFDDGVDIWLPGSDVNTTEEIGAERRYERMGLAIQQVQQEALANGDEWEVVYSLCEWGDNQPWLWGSSVGGVLWRTTFDIQDSFSSVLSLLDQQVGLEEFSGPNAWNDPDMLEVGNGGMTVEEYRTHFSLWSLLNAPLIAGNDVRTIDTEEERAADATTAAYHDILTNEAVIAVDQDWGGKQGYLLRDDGDQEIWVKPMSDGQSVAVVLLNRGAESANITVDASELHAAGLASSSAYEIDDVWSDEPTVSTGSSVRAAPTGHASAMYIVSPTADDQIAPSVTIDVVGENYVEAGETTEVDVTVHNDSLEDLTDVEVGLTAPSGWTVTALGSESADDLAGQSGLTARYSLSTSADAAVGDANLVASATYEWGEDSTEYSVDGTYVLHLVRVPGEGEHQLSDLSWARSANGAVQVVDQTGDGGIGRDTATDGTTLNINGTEYAKGVGTQAPSSVVVYLGGTCSALTGLAGVQQTTSTGGPGGGGGSATFSILGDDETLWSSDGAVSSTTDGQGFSVDVTGVQVIEFSTVGSGGFNPAADKANWINTIVTCDKKTDEVLPSISLGTDTVQAGSHQTLVGSGFVPEQVLEVSLHSTPVLLGSVTTDSAGNFSFGFVVPEDTTTGAHSIQVSSSGVTLATVAVTVTAASSSSVDETDTSGETVASATGLASTGVSPAGAVWLAVFLLVAGGSAVVAFRVRRGRANRV
ncbi:NPCBM/NEW2 domain-containing protein [Okibacterium endophyticum]